jgi:glucose/arabinose dehydrogenase
LRNPWRFSFDRVTGDLYIGDVGQSRYEEINFQPASSGGGENYGWDILEGNHCYEPSTGCTPPPGYVAPVAEYSHGDRECSVTGGFVYRGQQYPGMQGIYFYGDYCSGKIWGLRRTDSKWETMLLEGSELTITSFGEDEAGELYLTDYRTGMIYQIRQRSR